jgi:alkylation response protein AidB-like acyl-CoA dehydrogenase
MAVSSVVNRRDLDFYLHEWLGLEELLQRPRFAEHDKPGVDAVISLAVQLAEREYAPHLRASDINEPSIDASGNVKVLPAIRDAVRLTAAAGLYSAAFNSEFGGLQLPQLVHVAAMGVLMGGSIATAGYMLLTVANARLLTVYGNAAQIAQFAIPQIAGASLGTMCLSEPHAGSSLGDIRTRAEPDGEDAYGSRFRVTGNKMWISGGDQNITENIVHLVMAKIPGPDGKMVDGSSGISLFIVPKILPDGQANDIAVAGLNHKMGYRGLPNCALNFGEGRNRPEDKAGAVGWLVGTPGRGLAQMFQMMNEARVTVGLGGAMLAYRGFLMSLDYARVRTQGRLPGVTSGPAVPIIAHADVKRMLLAQKSYAEGALALVLYSARLLDEEATAPVAADAHAAAALLALLTPVTKTWPSEWAQQSLELAIQIHGGAGYCRDFEVELLYRDNKLNTIHEGTTGVQAIDLVGRKLRKDQGKSYALMQARVAATVAAAGCSARLRVQAEAIARAWSAIDDAVAWILHEPDQRKTLDNATPFLFAFGHAVVAWLWLDQAVFCDNALQSGVTRAEQNFREGKLRACRYFVEFELPKIAAWLAPVMMATDVTSSMPDDQFAGELI